MKKLRELAERRLAEVLRGVEPGIKERQRPRIRRAEELAELNFAYQQLLQPMVWEQPRAQKRFH